MTHEEEIASYDVALARMHGKVFELAAEVDRYAGVAKVAIETIGVLQAHLSYLSESDKKRLAADLKARGLNVEQVMSCLGIVVL